MIAAAAAIRAIVLETMPIARERTHPHNPRPTRKKRMPKMKARDKRGCKRPSPLDRLVSSACVLGSITTAALKVHPSAQTIMLAVAASENPIVQFTTRSLLSAVRSCTRNVSENPAMSALTKAS